MFTYEFEEEDVNIFYTPAEGEKEMVVSVCKSDFERFAEVVQDANRAVREQRWGPIWGR